MEIYLGEKYNNKILKSKNNVILIYGSNAFGKTHFLNSLKTYLQNKSNFVFSEKEFDDNRKVIEIGEEWDLKKELSLLKSSSTRKFIVEDTLNVLEKSNLDLTSELNSNLSLNFILNHINKIINVEEKRYFIRADFSFKNDSNIIDSLFKLKIVDEDNNEINESLIPKSIRFQLFSKLLIETSPQNKIIMFDCPETYLDGNYQIKFLRLIKTLSENNLVFITFRNPFFLNKIKFDFDELYYFDNNQQIKTLYLSKTILIQIYLLINQNFWSFKLKTLSEYEEKMSEINFVSYEEDYQKIKNNVLKNFIPIFFDNLDFLKQKLSLMMLTQFSENEQLIFLLLAKSNGINFGAKVIEFKSKLINEIFEILIN